MSPLPCNTFRAQLQRAYDVGDDKARWQLCYSLNGHIRAIMFEQQLDEGPHELSTRMQETLAQTIANDMLCEAFERVWRG